MPFIRELDPGASPLDFFGSELRRLREAAGLSQDKLGSIIYCTGSLVGQVETAFKCPTREFTERVDPAVNADGALLRLLKLVLRSELPKWFQPYAELEAEATHIYTYQVQLVHGLLQTEDYARAVLKTDGIHDLEAKLAARMERQRILQRLHPPVVWVILDEGVLHRPIGSREIMRAQLAHLLSFDTHEWVHLQVLPFEVGAHAGLEGSFNMLRFTDHPDLLYYEGYGRSHMTADPFRARDFSLRYDRLQAAALSEEDSAALIADLMEHRYGADTRPE